MTASVYLRSKSYEQILIKIFRKMTAFPVLTVIQVVSIFSHLMPKEKQCCISMLFQIKIHL